MSEIPTAEEFYNDDLTPLQNMIEFTKSHVKAALKAASENAEMSPDQNQDFRLQNCNCTDYIINKESILNAYSLELIK